MELLVRVGERGTRIQKVSVFVFVFTHFLKVVVIGLGCSLVVTFPHEDPSIWLSSPKQSNQGATNKGRGQSAYGDRATWEEGGTGDSSGRPGTDVKQHSQKTTLPEAPWGHGDILSFPGNQDRGPHSGIIATALPA